MEPHTTTGRMSPRNRAILQEWDYGATQISLARKYGLSPPRVRQILSASGRCQGWSCRRLAASGVAGLIDRLVEDARTLGWGGTTLSDIERTAELLRQRLGVDERSAQPIDERTQDV